MSFSLTLSHVGIFVTDIQRMVDFYTRFLGFVVSRHKLELYGICSECREGRPGRRERGVQRVE